MVVGFYGVSDRGAYILDMQQAFEEFLGIVWNTAYLQRRCVEQSFMTVPCQPGGLSLTSCSYFELTQEQSGTEAIRGPSLLVKQNTLDTKFGTNFI